MGFMTLIVQTFGIGAVRINGHSMAPILKDGDYGLYRLAKAGKAMQPGAIALVQHPQFGLIVKTLGPRTADGAYPLSGISTLSSSKEALGLVSHADIRGLLFARISRHGVSRLPIATDGP